MKRTVLLLKYLGLYYVSGTLILFAVAKFTGAQFQELNVVKQIPLGDVTNRQLAWAFFGRSYGYTLCIGIFEFFAGVLILFERTRLAGLLLACSMYVNVVLIDRAFEVNDAVQHATIELIIVLVWLSGYRKELKRTFWDRSEGHATHKPLGAARSMIYLRFAFLLCCTAYALYRYRARLEPQDRIIGAYKVLELSVDSGNVDLGQGEYTTAPMLFFEFKTGFVLSVRDSSYRGSYKMLGDSVLLLFDQEFNGIRSLQALVNKNGLMEGTTNKGERLKIRTEKIEVQDHAPR